MRARGIWTVFLLGIGEAPYNRGVLRRFTFLGFVSINVLCFSQPQWDSEVEIPPGGRPNPFQFTGDDYLNAVENGKLLSLLYPVTVGPLIPEQAFQRALDLPPEDPFRKFLQKILKENSSFQNSDELFEYLGLQLYPEESGISPYFVPFPKGVRPDYRMSYSPLETAQGAAFTLGCATCHSGNLFGKKVIGLTNRFQRANEFFELGKKVTDSLPTSLFSFYTKASKGEQELYENLRIDMRAVGVKRPSALGLDNSLAQVALSLARRKADPYASKSTFYETFPRTEPLEKKPSESKPAVWWTLKYKNRFLLDGSVVSGNPILTNFLWNELGRGTDLVKLESWIAQNQKIIAELTTAVFSTQAPKITDFFPADRISEAKARKGEVLFEAHCAKCHGHYEKVWQDPTNSHLSWGERLQTKVVRYQRKTFVVDVGTDPWRYQGMASLEKGLNPLQISKLYGIRVEVQKGYVPPPLEGIWSRWPYFHNNSVPSLCSVLDPQEKRPKKFSMREAIDPERDFDSQCNGYPMAEETEFIFDTSIPGLSNQGHDEGILRVNGIEIFSIDDKRALISFLQTL